MFINNNKNSTRYIQTYETFVGITFWDNSTVSESHRNLC